MKHPRAETQHSISPHPSWETHIQSQNRQRLFLWICWIKQKVCKRNAVLHLYFVTINFRFHVFWWERDLRLQRECQSLWQGKRTVVLTCEHWSSWYYKRKWLTTCRDGQRGDSETFCLTHVHTLPYTGKRMHAHVHASEAQCWEKPTICPVFISVEKWEFSIMSVMHDKSVVPFAKPCSQSLELTKTTEVIFCCMKNIGFLHTSNPVKHI